MELNVDKIIIIKFENKNYSDRPLIFRSSLSSLVEMFYKLMNLEIPFVFTVSKYTLISRFWRSTNKALSSGKHSRYLLYQSKANLDNTELKVWIKLWSESWFE